MNLSFCTQMYVERCVFVYGCEDENKTESFFNMKLEIESILYICEEWVRSMLIIWFGWLPDVT